MQIHIKLTRARSPSKAKALCRTSGASSVQQCKSRSLKEHCETCKIVIETTSRNHTITAHFKDLSMHKKKKYVKRRRKVLKMQISCPLQGLINAQKDYR
jgi:hypothetical protein